jgi:hypothetical protein
MKKLNSTSKKIALVAMSLAVFAAQGARADALDRNQEAASCRIAQRSAEAFIANVSKHIDHANQIEDSLHAQTAAKVSAERKVEILKSVKENLSSLNSAGITSDGKSHSLSDVLLGQLKSPIICGGITDPKTLSSDVAKAASQLNVKLNEIESALKAVSKAQPKVEAQSSAVK